MISEKFLIVGAIVQVIGSLGYLIETIKGKTQPNRVTWLLWGIIPGIAFLSQINQGVGAAAMFTFVIGFIPIVIFLATFLNKKAVWKLGRFDYVCGALAILGLILWFITKVGNLAILLSIIADFFAAVPTLVKAYRNPESESYKDFLGSVIYGVITLLTLQQWGFEYWGFAAYVVAFDSTLVYFIGLRPRLIMKRG